MTTPRATVVERERELCASLRAIVPVVISLACPANSMAPGGQIEIAAGQRVPSQTVCLESSMESSADVLQVGDRLQMIDIIDAPSMFAISAPEAGKVVTSVVKIVVFGDRADEQFIGNDVSEAVAPIQLESAVARTTQAAYPLPAAIRSNNHLRHEPFSGIGFEIGKGPLSPQLVVVGAASAAGEDSSLATINDTRSLVHGDTSMSSMPPAVSAARGHSLSERAA